MPASRSLIALLVGTVVFFALWMVALKPSSSSSGGGSSSSHGLGGLQSDINKAKQAVGTSNASNAASGNENAPQGAGAGPASHRSPAASTGPSAGAKSSPSATSSTTKPSQPAAGTSQAKPASAAQNLSTVQAAMSSHKVVAMLFYNPAATDDQAVRHELSSVPTHRGGVVKLAVPLKQASSFVAVTQQVPLNFSPTLVLISPTDQVTEIVGYADSFEIDQRVADALAAG